MNKSHLIIIYSVLAILAFFIFSKKTDNVDFDLSRIENRISRVEFFQETTRIRDNLVGFKQVNASLANDKEREKSCNESKDLILEWSEDVKKLGNDYSGYINDHQDAKEYFDSISKLNDTIVADCTKFASK